MKKAMTIIALAFVVVASVGMWFTTRRTWRVPTTASPPPSVPAVARPMPVPAVPDARPESSVGAAPPVTAESPVVEPRARARAQARELASGNPQLAPQARPEPAEPGGPAKPVGPPPAVEPEQTRQAAIAPTTPPSRPTERAAPELPLALEPEASLAAPSTAGRAGPSASAQVELASVRQVLERYEQMYDQLDASMAASLWPRMDSRALARVFARLERQDLSFDGCAVAVAESRATAHCTGWLSYVPRIGNSSLRRERHSWTIEFERTAEEWRILDVGAR